MNFFIKKTGGIRSIANMALVADCLETASLILNYSAGRRFAHRNILPTACLSVHEKDGCKFRHLPAVATSVTTTLRPTEGHLQDQVKPVPSL